MFELVDKSLISVNTETSLIAIHCLIQAAYWDRMDTNLRRKAFEVSLALFNESFPTKNNAGHMYDRHQACQLLIQHVQGFTARYLELRNDGFTERVENMNSMLCSAAW
jgi:hypothetical protein